MFDRIKEALLREGISKWKITESRRIANEYYFIKDKLDMNRSKDVKLYEVVVYVDYELESKKYTGSTTGSFSESLSDGEILTQLREFKAAANYVMNPFYTLPTPDQLATDDQSLEHAKSQSNGYDYFSDIDIVELIESIYLPGRTYVDIINSCEVFLRREFVRIKNSEGLEIVDVYNNHLIELVTECRTSGESVEMIDHLKFGDIDYKKIQSEIRALIESTILRANAKPMKAMKHIPVVLGGDAVVHFFDSYVKRANAVNKYNGLTTFELDKAVVDGTNKGDRISIMMVPSIDGSGANRVYDEEGIRLSEVPLIETGILKKFYVQ